jgi:hypothetical protein
MIFKNSAKINIKEKEKNHLDKPAKKLYIRYHELKKSRQMILLSNEEMRIHAKVR